MKPPVKFVPKGNHHAYYGIAFILFGISQYYLGLDNGNLSVLSKMWLGIAGIGVYLLVDDIMEHTITASTPMRILYNLLFNQKD